MSTKKKTQRKEIYIYITRKNKYIIPIDSPFLLEICPSISDTISIKYKYHVQSKVSWEVLQSFLDYGIYRKIPDINDLNYDEYEELSKEFDFMKDVIQLHQKFLPSIKKRRITKIRKEVASYKLRQLHEDYQTNIHLLLKYGHYDSTYGYSNLKNDFQYYNMSQITRKVMKKIKYGDGEYAINEYNKTAGVIGFNSKDSEFNVPNEIEYESEKYPVTSLLQLNSEIKHKFNVKFQPNSPLKLIAKSSLDNFDVIGLTIPSSVERIEEGFSTMRSNIMIQILDNNNENNNILNAAYCYAIKSAPQLDHYDILFAPEFRSGYQEISSCIKRIASYAFVEGDLGNRVVFRPNSTLESIGFHSFFRCKLRSICFPASLTVIEEEAFRCCELHEVEFPFNSKLKKIGSFAFGNNYITTLKLPSSLTKLEFGCFAFNKITDVYFGEDSQLEEIEEETFFYNCLSSFIVPPNVKKIGKKNFYGEKNVTHFELTSKYLPEINDEIDLDNIETFVIPSHLIFDSNEKWKKYIFKANEIIIKKNDEVNIKYIQNNKFIIGKSATSDKFSVLYYVYKTITTVRIPSQIETISSYSFYNCNKLKMITFEDNSKLKMIENSAFAEVPIEKLSIPSSVCILQNECFKDTNNLIKINIIPNQIQNVIFFKDSMLIGKRKYNDDDAQYDTIHFVSRNLTKIEIPSNIKEISTSSFDGCKKINEIDFEKDSNLEVINKYQFRNLNITRMVIPSSVNSFGDYSFSNCKYLKFIDIKDDSKLASIGDYALSETSIKSLFIPSSVSKINLNAFYGLIGFQIFEIGKDSNLKSIKHSHFKNNALLMVPVELSYKVDMKK